MNTGFDRLRIIAVLVAAALAVAVSARFDFAIPGSPVPQSAQTLAVLCVGAGLGATSGALALMVYLVGGLLGAPAFAGGASGLEAATGPSAGYLIGFVCAAWIAGLTTDRLDQHPEFPLLKTLAAWLLTGVLAHALILALGFARLSLLTGTGEAWNSGVAPFLWGGAAKSALAAVLALGLRPAGAHIRAPHGTT